VRSSGAAKACSRSCFWGGPGWGGGGGPPPHRWKGRRDRLAANSQRSCAKIRQGSFRATLQQVVELGSQTAASRNGHGPSRSHLPSILLQTQADALWTFWSTLAWNPTNQRRRKGPYGQSVIQGAKSVHGSSRPARPSAAADCSRWTTTSAPARRDVWQFGAALDCPHTAADLMRDHSCPYLSRSSSQPSSPWLLSAAGSRKGLAPSGLPDP